MGQPPHRVILDVHLLLVRGQHVLLTQRRGGYGSGMWHLPSGKAEAGESVEDAVIREAYEEVGVTVDAADLRCVHALHVQHSGEEPRVGFFFEATRWAGQPSNREPDKCSAVQWFCFTEFPDEMIPYPAAGISAYLQGIPFSVFGWKHGIPRPTSPPLQRPATALADALPA
ncbi:MAG: NUDIX hydrolase [Pseudonocardiaceae bacterium]